MHLYLSKYHQNKGLEFSSIVFICKFIQPLLREMTLQVLKRRVVTKRQLGAILLAIVIPEMTVNNFV